MVRIKERAWSRISTQHALHLCAPAAKMLLDMYYVDMEISEEHEKRLSLLVCPSSLFVLVTGKVHSVAHFRCTAASVEGWVPDTAPCCSFHGVRMHQQGRIKRVSFHIEGYGPSKTS